MSINSVRRSRFWPVALASVVAAATGLLLVACGSTSTTTPSPTPTTSATSSSLAAMVPANIRAMGTITVPSSIEFPPFEYFTPGTTNATGLDIDIMNAIADKLGIKFKFINFKFESIIPSIQNGRYVIAMSSMSDTTAREKQVDFVDYFVDGEQIMVPAANPNHINGYADLSGKTVALAVGDTDLTTAAQQNKILQAAGKAPMKGITLPGTPQDLAAIDSGRAVATIIDAASGAYDVKTTGKYLMVGPITNTGPYGIDFPKGASQFEAAVQAALNALKADGTYQQILTKWGEAAGAIKSFTVNAAAAYGQ
jgi:polar amino acid transport system substrate-binding protein